MLETAALADAGAAAATAAGAAAPEAAPEAEPPDDELEELMAEAPEAAAAAPSELAEPPEVDAPPLFWPFPPFPPLLDLPPFPPLLLFSPSDPWVVVVLTVVPILPGEIAAIEPPGADAIAVPLTDPGLTLMLVPDPLVETEAEVVATGAA